MVRHDRIFPQAFGQMAGGAFRQAASIDEDQGGVVLFHQGRQAPINLFPHLVGHDRAQGRLGDRQAHVPLPLVAAVDNPAGPLVAQKPGHRLDRLLGCGKANAHRRASAQRVQARQRQQQMSPALGPGHGVNLIDDDAAHAGQHGPSGLGGEQDEQGFRRGDQDVRRSAAHLIPLAGRGIAGAHRCGQRLVENAGGLQLLRDSRQRRLQVIVNIGGQGLQRGNVKYLDAGAEGAANRAPHQLIDAGQKGGQCLAGARGRGDQHVLAGLDRRPGLLLGRRRCAETRLEPSRHRRVKGLCRRVACHY